MSYSAERNRIEQGWAESQRRYQEQLDRDMAQISQQAAGKNQLIQTQYDTDAGLALSRKEDADRQQNETTDKALRDAYVGKMLNARNIGQQLAAMGRSGGAAESTLLGLQNNYQTNRAGLEEERARQLAAFLSQYNTTMADLDKTKAAGLQGVADWQADQERAARNTYNTQYENGLNTFNSNILQIIALEEQARRAAEAAAAQAAARSSSGGSVRSAATAEKGYDNGMLQSWANMNNTMSPQQIYNELKRQGYSDAAIAKAADFFAPTGE